MRQIEALSERYMQYSVIYLQREVDMRDALMNGTCRDDVDIFIEC